MLDQKFSKVRVDREMKLGPNAQMVVTSTAGVESTINMAELAALDNIAASDLAKIDGITNGTAAVGKALVLGASGEIATITSLTATTVNAGASGTAGTANVFPATASKGKLAVTVTDQTGDTTVGVVVGAMAAARTITLRDPGAAASFLTTTDATAAATTATAAEISNQCDVSTRIVNVTTTPLAVTEAAHSGKTLVLDKADGLAITLPAAAAGLKFRFIIKTTITSASTIKSATGADIMVGYALMGNDSDNTVVRWPVVAGDTADTIDLLGTSNSTGGLAGQEIEIEGLATNLWFVKIVGDAAGTEASPFANTVA